MSNVLLDKQIYECHYTDAGNAEALALLYGDQLLYVHGLGWHVWTGQYWKPDAEDEAMQFVRKLAKKRQLLVIANQQDRGERKKEMVQAFGLENTRSINSCLRMAQSTKPFSCLPSYLDTNPYLLACSNGTVQLDIFELREADARDLITHFTAVPYNREAKCPRWEKFLEEVLILPDGTPDYDLIEWLKKALGICMTGEVNERCCFVCHGTGANGKTTLMNVLNHVLGSYAGTTPFTHLTQNRDDTTTNDIAAMCGKRVVSAAETDQLRYLDEIKIKQLTGGDLVTCRFLYHEFFTYRPTYKIWMLCNHKPRIRGTDQAIWDRIKMIPFNARFEDGRNMDKDLLPKLLEEAEGILAWMIEGCIDWRINGFEDCQTVKNATKSYRTEEDAFMHFLYERTVPMPGFFVTAQAIWNAYNTWAVANGEKEIASTIRLGMEMSKRGYATVRKQAQRGFEGIGLV